jgi:uncharacterized protein
VRIYVDSSALLKRVVAEAQSAALTAVLRQYASTGDAMVSSAVAWVEVSRALRAGADTGVVEVDRLVDVAMSGVLEKPVSAEVVALARRLDPRVLRSLDAIHLASALLIDADVIVAYDQRLSAAAAHHGIRAIAPHR